MRALRIGEHALLVLLGLAAGIGLDGGLQPWSGPLFVALIAAALVVGRYRPATGAVWALAPGAALLAVVAVIDGWEAVSALVVAALTVGLPWSMGRARRQHVDLLAAERVRSEALLAERAAVAEGARLAERSRLAADIHHTLGHELALISVRAGALEVAGDPGQRDAAAAVRASAVAATDHLRRALDLLDPAPPAVGVEEIVARARRAGIDVDLADRTGGVALPDPAARLVEHTVREAITNAARHAAGAPVRVGLDTDPAGLVARVSDTGGSPGDPGSGTGLARLREHADALGATLDAGPDGDGWALELRVPGTAPG